MSKYYVLAVSMNRELTYTWVSNDNVITLLKSGHKIYRSALDQQAELVEGTLYWKDVPKVDFKEESNG
jgi:hypothetical protein